MARYLCLAVFFDALCVTFGASDAATTASAGEIAATPPLFKLLNELRSEAVSSLKFQTSMAQWCHDSKDQKDDVVGVLHRRLQEANTSTRQLRQEEKRLASEESLAKSTVQEQKQRLKEAVATVKFATDEFKKETHQVDHIFKATERALSLVGATQAGNADSSASSGAAADAFKLAGGDVPAGSSSQELLDMLGQLRTRLTTEREEASKEHQAMLAKLHILSQNMESSIAEGESQVVALRMEAAQGRRELARREGQMGDVSLLLAAVEGSAAATKGACQVEEQRKSEVAAFIAAESGAVDALLRQLSVAPPPAAPAQVSEAPLSFLQTSRKRHALRKGPHKTKAPAVENIDQEAEAAITKDEEDHSVLLHKLDGMEADAQFTEDVLGGEEASGESSTDSALQNIQQFVQADGTKQPANIPEVAKDQAAPVGLLGRERAQRKKAAVEKKDEAQRHTQCSALLGKDSSESAKLAQVSGDMVSAKLRVAKAAVAEYEREATYSTSQKQIMQTQLEKFDSLAKVAETQTEQNCDKLHGHAEQLMALATDLSSQLTSDEQKGAVLARSLSQKILSQVGVMRNQQTAFAESRGRVESADQKVMKLLDQDVDLSRRRIVQLGPETQLLTSLAQAKDRDRTLANEYQELAEALCSTDKQLVVTAHH